MAYSVILNFHDIEDNNRLYEVGQSYPREGFEVDEERIQSLSTSRNKGGKPFIKEIEEFTNNGSDQDENPPEGFPKHTGGGWYELSNGDKVQGKEEAHAAEAKLQSGE